VSVSAQPDAVVSAAERTRLDQLLVDILADLELDYERPEQGAFLVKLPGEHKLATMCWLVVQDFSLLVEAFFMRKPDENAEGLYRWLLQRNSKMYGLAFSVDRLGDVFLVGRRRSTSRRLTACSAACCGIPTTRSTPLSGWGSRPPFAESGTGGASAARARPTWRPSPGSRGRRSSCRVPVPVPVPAPVGRLSTVGRARSRRCALSLTLCACRPDSW